MQIQGETSVNKLIILFVFDKMEAALSERTVLEMCASGNNWLHYMDCKELLPRLIDDGFLCRATSAEEEPLYVITGEGRESLNNFYINIPKSIRDEITTFIKNNSGKLRNRQECKSDYFQNVDGTYTVFLKILAPVQPMLELKFVVPDKKGKLTTVYTTVCDGYEALLALYKAGFKHYSIVYALKKLARKSTYSLGNTKTSDGEPLSELSNKERRKQLF